MITKMKKLTFLVYHKEYEPFLDKLRSLGLVHVAEKQTGTSDDPAIQSNLKLLNRLNETLKFLMNQKPEKADKADQADQPEKADQAEKTRKDGKPANAENAANAEKAANTEKAEDAEKAEDTSVTNATADIADVTAKNAEKPANADLADVTAENANATAEITKATAANVGGGSTVEVGVAARGLKVLDEVDALQADYAKWTAQLQTYDKERDLLMPWGDFSWENLDKLKASGYAVGFYICSDANYNEEWEKEYNAIIIHRMMSKVFFITLTKADQEIEIDAEKAKLPTLSLSELEQLRKELAERMEEYRRTVVALSEKEIPSLKAAIKEVQSKIEYSKVVLNTESAVDDKLMLLEGWAPAGSVPGIQAYLDESDAYYQISNPTPDDNVPILLNNKGFFSWFEPICKLYMLPKYNELDLTPYFAPFFMVFFGLCLGDSGYGLFLFAAVTIYRMVAKKISATMKPILSLVQVLSVSTFFCGLLTGTFFGANMYELDWPFMKQLKEHLFMDNNDMFQLSLILGVVQILFGMGLKAANQIIQFGFKYGLATIGWMILLISTAFAALLPDILPMGGTVHLAILGVSGLLIFLINSPDKNIFANIGLGLWDTYNMATGLLGDILSYVRLFALGLSGGILASVFNSLAVGMSPDNIIAGPIVMVLIFVIGHAINIFMNVLGAMVHPMRLTFVEFFKNSGYEGGGKMYQPFKQ